MVITISIPNQTKEKQYRCLDHNLLPQNMKFSIEITCQLSHIPAHVACLLCKIMEPHPTPTLQTDNLVNEEARTGLLHIGTVTYKKISCH